MNPDEIILKDRINGELNARNNLCRIKSLRLRGRNDSQFEFDNPDVWLYHPKEYKKAQTLVRRRIREWYFDKEHPSLVW